MVDMNGLQKGAIGLVSVIVTIVLGTVLADQLGQTAGLGNDAVAAAQNGTSLLGSILSDWGSIIVLGMIVIFVFVGILSALTFLASRGGAR